MRRAPLRPTRLAGAWAAALGAAALGVAACADAPTGADPFSLAFDRLPFPAVVAGDTLRDTSGVVAPLRAVVFGGDGAEIPDAPVSYLIIDRGAHLVDSVYAFGDSLGATVRVVAEAAGIPSQPLNLAVVLRPDSLSLTTTAPDTARYSPRVLISPADTSQRIEVRVLHRPAQGDAIGVGSWVVRYDVELYDGATPVPNDSLALLVGENSQLSVLDTTDAQGAAWRKLLLNGARPAIDAVDSAVVSVTILGRPAGTVSPKSVRVAVPVRIR